MRDARKNVIVIGSGIAGLLVSRMLSKYYQTVTILEKDLEPSSYDLANFRKGVPQANHVHLLLGRGLKILKDYFPDIENDLTKSNIEVVHDGVDNPTFTQLRWTPRRKTGIVQHGISRMFLENLLRQKVLSIKNVKIEYQTVVNKLLLSAGEFRVTGVRTANSAVSDSEGAFVDFAADLIVDCSGRTSKLGAWLKEMTVEFPNAYVCEKDLGYASRYYALPKKKRNWKALYVRNIGDINMGFVMTPVENGFHHLTLRGGKGNYPPHQEAEFLEFIKQIDKHLGMDLLWPEISAATPLSEIKVFRNMDCVRRSFADANKWPQGLVAVGDSFAYLDPSYGQGMSLSALAVSLLEEMAFKKNPPSSWIFDYYREYAKRAESAWWMATNGSLLSSAPSAKHSKFKKKMLETTNWISKAFFPNYLRLTVNSYVLFQFYTRVKHCLYPFQYMYNPGIMAIAFIESSLRRLVNKFGVTLGDTPYVPTSIDVIVAPAKDTKVQKINVDGEHGT